MTKKCKQCNKEFNTRYERVKLCSRSCFYTSRNKRIVKSCQVCNKEFRAKTKLTKFCSQKCTGIKRQARIIKSCLNCKEKFITHKFRTDLAKFCSHACYSKNKKDNFTPELREQLRLQTLNSPNRKFKDTKPELRMEELLKRLGVDYQKQVSLLNIARVDFYIQSKNLVIQVDGCFWHGCPQHYPTWIKNKERDMKQDKALKEKGISVIRFWEHEIMSPNFNILNLVN